MQLNTKISVVGFLFVTGYFFDEIINQIIGINISGFIFTLLATIYLLQNHYLEIFISKSASIWALVIGVFSLFAYISPLGCNLEMKGAFSLILAGILLLCFRLTFLARIVLEQRLSSLYLKFVLVALFFDYLGFGLMSLLFGASRDSGPYYEPSHLAFYILPFITFRILNNQRDYLSYFVIFASFFNAPSTTLMIGVMGLIALILFRNDGKYIGNTRLLILFLIMIFSVLVFFGFIDLTQYIDRILSLSDGYVINDRIGGNNLSSLVWLNGWSQALQTLNETMWLGVGFNQMGCGRFESIGIFSPVIIDTVGLVLNFNDGSFLAAKLISELGFIGLAVVFIMTYYSLKAILHFWQFRHFFGSLDSFYLAANSTGALCILSYLFVRGSGYFQLPILIAISLLCISNPNLDVKLNDKTP